VKTTKVGSAADARIMQRIFTRERMVVLLAAFGVGFVIRCARKRAEIASKVN
jgi:hypothetical protein